MNNSIYFQLINWFKPRHSIDSNNEPTNESTTFQLKQLTEQILTPLENVFGTIQITYGFTSAELTRYIQKSSRSGTAPSLDQHASHELNLNGSRISKRDGAACDFYVAGYENKMHEIVKFICTELPFDKLYYYGKDRPIHVSWSEEPLRHLQVIGTSKNGRRIPGIKAFGDNAVDLAKEL